MADPLVTEKVTLYGLPSNEFTAARNARAKELRKDDPELADAVAALPKPTAAAAALNRAAREDPSEVRALVQCGRRMREAQEAAIAGKKRPELLETIEEHRDALERVQRDLRKLELSGPVLEKAIQTLRVASVEPELQPLLERGILAEDLTASGFGLDPSLVPKRAQRVRRPSRKPDAEPDKETERRRREARARVTEAEEALTLAERAYEEAARAVDTAREELFRAQREAIDAG